MPMMFCRHSNCFCPFCKCKVLPCYPVFIVVVVVAFDGIFPYGTAFLCQFETCDVNIGRRIFANG